MGNPSHYNIFPVHEEELGECSSTGYETCGKQFTIVCGYQIKSKILHGVT